MTSKKVCFVGGGHISSTPRMIKEADCLHARGFDVLVLTPQVVESIVPFDEQVQRKRGWKIYNVPAYRRSILSKVTGKISKGLLRKKLFKDQTRLEEYTQFSAPWYRLFFKQIENFKPDLMIAHSISGLTVAALAKKRYGIPFGFDVEDHHSAEREGGIEDFSNRLGDSVMRMCLSNADYVTISSPHIAEEIRKQFPIKRSEVVLNAFPLGELKSTPHRSLSIYWFSQSIGLDRGLTDVLEACRGLKGDFELHLQGGGSPEVCEKVFKYAEDGGYRERLFIHPRCGADELVQECMKYDVGLALECPVPLNRDWCITNKILMYPVSGLAIAATKTSGQSWVMEQIPSAGFLYAPGDVATLQSKLQEWIDHPERLQEAKKMSRRAAEIHFSWEKESLKFVQMVEEVLKLK